MARSRWPWSRRTNKYDPPTFLDQLLSSPIRMIINYLHLLLLALRGRPFKPPHNKPPIKIVCISDTHSHTPTLPTGDVLIHAGDLTNSGTVKDIQAQLDWLESVPGFKYKLLIAGNHDSYFDTKSRKDADKASGTKLNFHKLQYLQNESVQLKFKGGRTLSFYGAADIPACGGDDFAFQYKREDSPWAKRIPLSTDVLITHTPPKHHLDIGLGCDGLLKEIWRVKPRLHVFGHIHSGHGRRALYWDEGQASYERLLSRPSNGVIGDLIPSAAWVDAVKILWYDVKGVFWQYLMVGRRGANGGLLINAALVYQSTSKLGNPVEVVEI